MINVAAGIEAVFGTRGVPATISAIDAVSQAFTGAEEGAISAYASTERLQQSLQALIAQELLGIGATRDRNVAMERAAGLSRDLYEWTSQLAVSSPFSLGDISDAAKLGIAYNFLASSASTVAEAQERNLLTTQRVTQASLDFVAGTGSAGYVTTELVSILGKAQATGKLLSEDFTMLADRGVPIFQLLADHMGVTTQEITNLRSEGKILADDALPAIVEWMERMYGGAAEAQGSTMAGLLASLGDIQTYLGRDILTPAIETTLQPALARAVEMLQSAEMEDQVKAWGLSVAEMADTAIPYLEDLEGTLSDLTPAIGGVTAALGTMAAIPILASLVNPLTVAAATVGVLIAAILEDIRRTNEQIEENLLSNPDLNWQQAQITATAAEAAQVDATLALRDYDQQMRIAQATIRQQQAILDDETSTVRERADAQRILNEQFAITEKAAASEAERSALRQNLTDAQAEYDAIAEEIKQLEEQTVSRFRASFAQPLDEMWLVPTPVIWYGPAQTDEKIAPQINALSGQLAEAERRLSEATGDWEAYDAQQSTTADSTRDTTAAIQEQNDALSDEATTFREGSLDAYLARLEAMAEEERTHAANVREIDQQVADERADAYADYTDEIAQIEQQHQEAIIAEMEAWADRLAELAEDAADAARGAFGETVESDVDFIQGAEGRLEDYNARRRTLHRQGALACSQEELEALIQQEQDAAASYVEQEAELNEHLARRLIAYTQSQALIHGVSNEALAAMTAGIAAEFGVVQTASERTFVRMRADIDQWARTGGQGTDTVIAGFGRYRQEAVQTQLEIERVTRERTDAIAQQYAEGRLSEEEYIAALQDVPRQVATQYNLVAPADLYDTDVTQAHEDHQDRLVEIDEDANEDRLDAFRDWQAEDERLRTDHHQQLLEDEQARHDEAMAQTQTQYAEQLAALLAQYDAFSSADQAYLASYRIVQAERLVEIGSWADRELDAIEQLRRAGAITDDEAVARAEAVLAQGATRRRRVEQYEDYAASLGDFGSVDYAAGVGQRPTQRPTSVADSPFDPAPVATSPFDSEPVPPPRPDQVGAMPPSGGPNVTVNINNPTVDSQARAEELRRQAQEATQAALMGWTDDLITRRVAG